MRLPVEKVADVEQAAFLHDIGKIGIPDAILKKQGPLDDMEWKAIREHSIIGERIVSSIKELAHLAPVTRAAHERWDGRGYPDGRSGEEIPLASRIIFVCDAFHAMISDRPYRRALDVRTALEELQKNAGMQFCPLTVEAFFDVIGRPGGGRADPAGLQHGTF
jgi:HD-GYP domain-containing protein (c-di-GMP phosphodiesterase class II)